MIATRPRADSTISLIFILTPVKKYMNTYSVTIDMKISWFIGFDDAAHRRVTGCEVDGNSVAGDCQAEAGLQSLKNPFPGVLPGPHSGKPLPIGAGITVVGVGASGESESFSEGEAMLQGELSATRPTAVTKHGEGTDVAL